MQLKLQLKFQVRIRGVKCYFYKHYSFNMMSPSPLSPPCSSATSFSRHRRDDRHKKFFFRLMTPPWPILSLNETGYVFIYLGGDTFLTSWRPPPVIFCNWMENCCGIEMHTCPPPLSFPSFLPVLKAELLLGPHKENLFSRVKCTAAHKRPGVASQHTFCWAEFRH